MAKIIYERFLLLPDSIVTITNADTDYLTTTTPESFINPPIKMRFLNTGGISFEELCQRAVDDDEFEISHEDTLRMVRGELPGWRLVGIQFSVSGGLSAYYANENPPQTTPTGNAHCYTFAKGMSFFFVEDDCLEVELEVDYADGLPMRRYIGKVSHDETTGLCTEIVEFLGKRKIQKLQFSETGCKDEGKQLPGCLCHITEY